MQRRSFLVTATALILYPLGRALAALPDGRAQEVLRRGAAVIYVRHGATTWSGVDRIEWPRERQRLLSDLGEAQARNLGESFSRQGWPVGDVLASPFARCAEMAQIAFGRVRTDPMLLGLASDDKGVAQRRAYSEQLVNMTTTGGNRVIVGHQSNIRAATGASLPEGGAVVLLPGAAGPELLATLSADDFADLARSGDSTDG